MRHRHRQGDVPHAFASDDSPRDLHTTFFADHSFVTDFLVLAAVTFPVLDRSEDALAKKSVAFRFLGAIVDRFRLGDFSVGPLANAFRRSNLERNGVEAVTAFAILSEIHARMRKKKQKD